MEEKDKLEQNDYLKLTKNTKGYNWEVKVSGTEDEDFLRLVDLNERMLEKFYTE